uniref:Ig-like domain-containing protein n=1 Tax=Tetranychus urticae TaxID=32264 RepID=T1K5E0_TETUR
MNERNVLPEEVIITDYKGLRVNQVIGPVDEGTDLVLYCDAFGKPEPSVSWWMSDYTLLDDTYYKSPRGSMRNELTLNSLNRSILMKEIICRASNTNLTRPKEESIFIDLNLRPLEVFLVPPDKQLSANKQVAFECRTIGSRPRPFISWWLDGDKVTPLSETTNGDTNVTINTAIFIFKSYNNGKFFSCRAENPNLDESSIDEGMILNIVYVPLLKLTLGPNIKGENIREGFDVYLECIINANPRVFETSWMFEGKPLISDPSKRIIISNQSLVLQNISKHSRGRYQCVGRNEEGLGTSNPLYLRVQSSTIADNEPVDWLIWLIAIVLITLMITILILIGLRLIGNKGPNQNQGFVSIDYEAHPIRQEDVKSSPQMISASFKGQETCDGYPTSTSIVYKLNTSSLHTTVDDIRYETGIETSDYPATMFLETTLFEGSIDEASMEKQFIPFGKINLTQTQSNGPDECSQISTNDYSLRHIYQQFTDNTIKDIPL